MPGIEEIETEPDTTEGWAIQYVLIGTVAAILICAFVVWLFLGENLVAGGRSNPYYARTIPPQATFDTQLPLEAERHAKKLRLEQWTWADAAHTRVREPIGVAIDQFLNQPVRALPPQPPPPQELQ